MDVTEMSSVWSTTAAAAFVTAGFASNDSGVATWPEEASGSGDGGGMDSIDSDGDHFPAYMSLLMTLACGLILVVGLVGNCLVPVVIWNNRDLRNSTNLFLLNLSLADILVLCVSMPTVLVEIHQKPEVWVLGQFMCRLVPFVEFTVAHASVLTILAISFERYYVITKPLRAGYTCTRMRALFIILAIWVLGCVTSSPMLFIAQYKVVDEDGGDPTPVCLTQANTFWPIFYFVSAICLFFFFPLVVLVLIYSVIARHLVADPCTASNHRIQVQMSSSVASGGDGVNPNLRARRQVVAMLGTVVVFFFICLLPFRLFTLWIIMTPDEVMQSLSMETYYHALNFCRVMLYLNSAINPILYNVMSSKFRSAFLKALGLTWAGRRKRLLRHLSRQSTFNTTTTSGAAGTSSSLGMATSSSLSHHEQHGGGQQQQQHREFMKRLTKEALVSGDDGSDQRAPLHRPTLQKYGRQSSCCSSIHRASAKPLLVPSTPSAAASKSTALVVDGLDPSSLDDSHV